MGRKHLSLEDYLSKIPEEHRKNLKVLEEFHGNRTIISFTYPLCGCETKKQLKELLSRKEFSTCSKCKERIIPDFLYTCDYCKKQFIQHNTFEAHYNKCQEYYSNCVNWC